MINDDYTEEELLGVLSILKTKKEEIESKIISHRVSMDTNRVVNAASVAYASAFGFVVNPAAALTTLAIGLPIAYALELKELTKHVDLVAEEVGITSDIVDHQFLLERKNHK